MLLPLLLLACSFDSSPLDAESRDKAIALQGLVTDTLNKMTSEYADVITGRPGNSSLIYFSGPYNGMTEINGFPMSADGVVVLRDNEPLWYSVAPNGDLLLSGDAGPTPGKALPNGGMSLSGKNDIVDPEITDFVFFVTELDAATHPAAVTLFRGWWAVHVNGPGDVHHALMTRTDRNIMLFGLAPESTIQVGLLARSMDRSTAEAVDEPTFDLGEVRSCKVPREGFTSVSWNSCSLIR